MSWQDLVEKLIGSGTLKDPDIIRAFNRVNRKDFMKNESKGRADEDRPFSIGYGQTISQPTTVAFMIELLQPKGEMKVLDVGSGSGWTSALLAEIARSKGQVYATEVIPQLQEFGKKNARQAGYDEIKFYISNGSLGLEKQAPFDRILVSATAPEVPAPLKQQLKEGGRLVIPVGDFTSSLYLIKRKDKDTFSQKEYPGFSFVPLKGEHGR